MNLFRRVPATVLTSVAALAVSGGVLAISDGSEVLRVVAIVIMLVAAAEDLRTRRLRNALVAPALVFALAADPALSTVAAGAICVAPFLAMAFWKPGSMGMGDVKFAAPAGALVGLQLLGTLLVAIALLGGVLALVAYARHGRSATLAYGPAIAVAALYVGFVL
jgi:leader peptidase (prepilin peptidase) / N-methyltransferase